MEDNPLDIVFDIIESAFEFGIVKFSSNWSWSKFLILFKLGIHTLQDICTDSYPGSNELLIEFKPASYFHRSILLLPNFDPLNTISDFDSSYHSFSLLLKKLSTYTSQ